MEFTKEELLKFRQKLTDVIEGRAEKSDLIIYACKDIKLKLQHHKNKWKNCWFLEDIEGNVEHITKLESPMSASWWLAKVEVSRIVSRKSEHWPYSIIDLPVSVRCGFSAYSVEELLKQIGEFLFDQIIDDGCFYYTTAGVLLKHFETTNEPRWFDKDKKIEKEVITAGSSENV